MKKLFFSLTLAAAATLIGPKAQAADAKDYQVTGPVLEVNPSYIVVQKGEQKWQIATSAATKGDKPKVGDKVTVHYSMSASDIEVKPAGADKKPEKAEKKAEKK